MTENIFSKMLTVKVRVKATVNPKIQAAKVALDKMLPNKTPDLNLNPIQVLNHQTQTLMNEIVIEIEILKFVNKIDEKFNGNDIKTYCRVMLILNK